MRKQKNHEQASVKKLSQIDPAKRTITSSWNVRNDSSNVNSILQPDYYLRSSNRCSSNKGVYKKCILSENSCYCKEKRIRPKLMSRPKSCMSLERFRDRSSELDLSRQLSTRPYTPYECSCKAEYQIRTVASNLVPKLHKDHCSCLEYTHPRQDYDAYREKQDEYDLRRLGNGSQIAESKKGGHENGNGGDVEPNVGATTEEDYSISTLLGTRHDSTKTASLVSSEPQGQSVRDLNAFRSQHFFETHSTGDLSKEIPRHMCVHRFRLDGRLLPEPLNADAYGRSRCSICSKHMEGDTMQLSKSYFGDKPSTVSLKNLCRRSELGLVPRSVSVGGSKSKIELLVDDGDERKFAVFVGKIRPPEYFNSFALRQQRMSC